MTDRPRYIAGCMTGTSLDALDVALVGVTGTGLSMRATLIGQHSRPLGELRESLHALASDVPQPPSVFPRAARAFGELHAAAVTALCEASLPVGATLACAAAHGQTISHRPAEGVSWQLLDPWPIVQQCAVPVVCDLRQADLIAGGQGAPITPIADWLLYRDAQRTRAVVNLGGICNVTVLPAGADPAHVRGGDISPCNLLLDGLARRLLNQPYDEDGRAAAKGCVDESMVESVRTRIDAAIGDAATLGREQFSDAWVDNVAAALRASDARDATADALASAADAIARRITASAVLRDVDELVLAGGGAHHRVLAHALERHATGATVRRSDALGIPADAREAMAMAVLGALSADGVPITLPHVTGARAAHVAGTWTGLAQGAHRGRQSTSTFAHDHEGCGDAAHQRASPGRGALATEQRLEASAGIDALSIEQILRLINEQDATVAPVVRAAIGRIAPLVEAVSAALARGGRLVYLGAGTSGRLGVLDAAECPPTFHSDPAQVMGLIAGGESALRQAVEGAEDDEQGADDELGRYGVNEADVVVGIAAGGTTPYVWGALRKAKQRGATTGLVTCVPRSQLEAGHDTVDLSALDHLIALPVGAEIITGSTRLKAGTATKLTLNMITTAAFIAQGKTWGHLMVDLRATNAKLRDRAERIVCQQAGVSREAAADVLARAEGRVKLALVMARLNVTAGEAQRRLDETHGHLRALLGAPW